MGTKGLKQLAGGNYSLRALLPRRSIQISRIILGEKAVLMLSGGLLLLVFIAAMAVVQFSSPDLAGVDGYYHIKFASLMRTQGLTPEFPWLPLTILNAREFYNHHFLFHVLLIPFTTGDLVSGAKWASVLFASLAFLSIWWLFRSQDMPYAGLWALGLLAVSEAFLYRMSMPRAQSLSLGVLALALYLLFSGKHLYLIPLSFVYVWLYDGFPLILIAAMAFTLADWISERRLDFRPLLFTVSGIGAGLLLNLYFPHDLVFVFRHLIPKLGGAGEVRVGNEWYPYTTAQIMGNSPLALVAFLSGVIALGLQKQRMDTRTATSLFLAIIFGWMLFQSRRFVEYFPAFALIFAGFAWAPLLSAQSRKPAFDDPLGNSRGILWGKTSLIRRRCLPIALTVVLLPGIFFTLRAAQDSIQSSQPHTLYAQASAWLVANTPERARIFQTDWDDFPRLFFYNTHNTYLVGLDPTYLHLFNPRLYDLWVDITRGEVEDPSVEILASFGAAYVFSDLDHADFLDQASRDPGLEEVYRDQEAVIFQVRE